MLNEFAMLLLKMDGFISSDEGMFIIMILVSLILSLLKENFVAMAMVVALIAISITAIKVISYTLAG